MNSQPNRTDGADGTALRRTPCSSARPTDGRVECTIVVRPTPDASVPGGGFEASIVGELTHCTKREVIDGLTGHSDARVELDLSSVEYFDAGGITALLLLRQRYEEAGGLLEVQRPTKHVRWVLDLVGLGNDLLRTSTGADTHSTRSTPTGAATTPARSPQRVG